MPFVEYPSLSFHVHHPDSKETIQRYFLKIDDSAHSESGVDADVETWMKANQSVQEENANVLVEVNSTVGKLPKLSSLLELCSAKTVSPLFFACPGVILSDFFRMANSCSSPFQY